MGDTRKFFHDCNCILRTLTVRVRYFFNNVRTVRVFYSGRWRTVLLAFGVVLQYLGHLSMWSSSVEVTGQSSRSITGGTVFLFSAESVGVKMENRPAPTWRKSRPELETVAAVKWSVRLRVRAYVVDQRSRICKFEVCAILNRWSQAQMYNKRWQWIKNVYKRVFS